MPAEDGMIIRGRQRWIAGLLCGARCVQQWCLSRLMTKLARHMSYSRMPVHHPRFAGLKGSAATAIKHCIADQKHWQADSCTDDMILLFQRIELAVLVPLSATAIYLAVALLDKVPADWALRRLLQLCIPFYGSSHGRRLLTRLFTM